MEKERIWIIIQQLRYLSDKQRTMHMRKEKCMRKRVKVICGICLLLLIGMSAIPVSAANVKAPYMAEQAIGIAPEVKVFLTGSSMKDTVKVGGTIDSESFVQKDEIRTFKDSKESMKYIILLDNSGSVNKAQFEEAKKQLVKMRKALNNQDEMLLYTVGTESSAGEKTNILGRTAKAKENKKEKSDCEKIKNIPYKGGANSKTVLYRSLNQVLAKHASPKMRTVVFMITDGEDDSQGKDIDKVSTSKEVSQACIPVYAVLLNNVSKVKNEEKMSYTKNKILSEKNCRGYFSDCSFTASTDCVKEAFKDINEMFEEGTYVVTLNTTTNRTIGKSKLKLIVEKESVEPIFVDYSDYKEDTKAPVIDGTIDEVNKNTVSFVLKDANGINKKDAKDKTHYQVQYKKENGDGKILIIKSLSVKMNKQGDEVTVTMSLGENLRNTDYILKCSNIRDRSQEENAMDTAKEFTVTEGENAKIAAIKSFIKSFWWIFLLILIAGIGLLTIRAIRKKASEKAEVNPDEFLKADSRLIRLSVTDHTGFTRDVDWNVEGSLFVGRSQICNIYFEDDMLSKQHFVIDVTKMGCYIEDLMSTNGTFVNGVRVTGRRLLSDGDMITVGREKIFFHEKRVI